MDGAVDDAGSLLIAGVQVKTTDRIVVEAELIRLAVEGDGMLSEGVGHVEAPREETFYPFGFHEVGSDVAHIDRLQENVHIIPVALGRGMGEKEDGLVAAVDIDAVRPEIIAVECDIAVIVDRPGLTVDVEGRRIEGYFDPRGRGLDPRRKIGR